jgi:hypothetical protein
MYPITLGDTFSVQQSVTGTGVFNGTDFARARVTLGPFGGGGVIRFAARLYGTPSNAYSVQLVDPGAGVAYPATTVEQNGSVIKVHLRRSTIAILATPGEVAIAINAQMNFAFPLRAFAQVDTGVCDAVAATPLTSGADPSEILGDELYPNQLFKWVRVNLDGGYFHFEQREPILVRQFEAKMILSFPTTLKWSIVNLTADFMNITAEKIPVFVQDLTLAAPDITVTDVRIPLMFNQALVCDCAAAGLVRVVARREARFPYL